MNLQSSVHTNLSGNGKAPAPNVNYPGGIRHGECDICFGTKTHLKLTQLKCCNDSKMICEECKTKCYIPGKKCPLCQNDIPNPNVPAPMDTENDDENDGI